MAECVYCKAEAEMYIGGDVLCVECSDAQHATDNPPEAEQHIRAALLQDILEATALKNEAICEFEAAVDQVPSGSAHPAVAQRIKHASNKLSIARKGMMTAHNRLDDYLGRGIVPKELSTRIEKNAAAQ